MRAIVKKSACRRLLRESPVLPAMLVGAAKFPVFRQIKLPLILAVGPDGEIDRQTAVHTRMSRIHAHSQSPIGCSCIRRGNVCECDSCRQCG